MLRFVVVVLGNADRRNDFPRKEGLKRGRVTADKRSGQRCSMLSCPPSVSVANTGGKPAGGREETEKPGYLALFLLQKLPSSCCVSVWSLAPPGEALDSVFSAVTGRGSGNIFLPLPFSFEGVTSCGC